METIIHYIISPNFSLSIDGQTLPKLLELLSQNRTLFTAVTITLLGILSAIITHRIAIIRYKLKAQYTLLEIKPLRITQQTPISTQQLFTIIHSIANHYPWLHRLFGFTPNYSLEICSTKTNGIKYYIRTPSSNAPQIKQNLLSYLPGITVNESDDYLTNEITNQPHTTRSFKLAKHFAYPLKSHTELTTHDPIAYITGAMTKPQENELILFQLLLSPTPNKLNPDHFQALREQNPDLYKQIHAKASQPLFKTSIRFFVSATNRNQITKRIANLSPTLASFNNGNYQSCRPIKQLLKIPKLQSFLLDNRLLNPLNNPILSTSEIADLYHLPYTTTTKTEDLQKQHSKQLPAPTSLKRSENLDITFAINTYGGHTTPIGLSLEERRRHMYILGATGTGKSTMLLSMINQDIRNGKGLAVLDPHGDLIENLLPLIPNKRIKDIIYFNPDDIGFPLGINLLELPQGLNPEDELRAKEYIAESIISLFQKIYTDKYSGPRMEYILRNTIHTAFHVPDATLFTVYKLLINAKFRNSVTRKIKDENLQDFWKYEFAKAGDYQKVKMISPITNKIGRFLFSPTAKRILEQPKSTVNFEQLMDEGKILLCNLSKGKIGEDNSEVFGIVIMTKIQLAALKRARQTQEDRRDFFLYVDEFQNFATPAFPQILSEARKYRLGAILAHQTTSQLETKSLVNITLANTGTVICFRTANPDDERLILPQFAPAIEKGEIASLPSYNFYIRLSAINPEEPFSGKTTPVTIKPNSKHVQEIITSSRNKYTIDYQKTTETKTKKTPKKTKSAEKNYENVELE